MLSLICKIIAWFFIFVYSAKFFVLFAAIIRAGYPRVITYDKRDDVFATLFRVLLVACLILFVTGVV